MDSLLLSEDELFFGPDALLGPLECDTDPLLPSAAPNTPPGEVLGLRCLDASHVQPCSMCTSAPPVESEGDYELRGSNGRKDGEKRRVLRERSERDTLQRKTRPPWGQTAPGRKGQAARQPRA